MMTMLGQTSKPQVASTLLGRFYIGEHNKQIPCCFLYMQCKLSNESPKWTMPSDHIISNQELMYNIYSFRISHLYNSCSICIHLYNAILWYIPMWDLFYHSYLQDWHFSAGEYCTYVWCLRMSVKHTLSLSGSVAYISMNVAKQLGSNARISLLKFYIAEKQNWSPYFSHTSPLENMTIELRHYGFNPFKTIKKFCFQWKMNGYWIICNITENSYVQKMYYF